MTSFQRVKGEAGALQQGHGEMDGSSGLSSRSAETVCAGCRYSQCKRNCQYGIATERQGLYRGYRSVALAEA